MKTSKFFRIKNPPIPIYQLHEFKTALIKESTCPYYEKITSSNDANKLFRPFFSEYIQIKEVMYAIFNNRINVPIGIFKVSEGGIGGTSVDPRFIAKTAIDLLASSVIIAHNHPSGNLKPSSADRDITHKIKNGLKLFDITLLDHLILTNTSYLSFQDEGLL